MKDKCSLLERVRQTIKEYRMFTSKERVLVGISGGPDSTALLHLLSRLKDEYELQLWAAHLNHKIRGREAEKEARWTEQFARKLKVPIIMDSFDVPLLAARKKLSLEEAARQARYDFFERIADRLKIDKIALGHTASDQVETILMRLIRGCGLDGLSGIPPVRGKIVRPLIRTFRGEIEEYCSENSLHPCTDSSNKDVFLLRNRIRLKLIPYLRENYNPQICRVLFQIGEILREENDFFRRETEKVFNSLCEEKEKDRIALGVQKLNGLHLALRRRAVREAIRLIRGSTRGVEFDHINSALKISEEGRGRLSLPGGISVRIDSGNLLFEKRRREEEIAFERLLNVPGRTDLPEVGLVFDTEIIYQRPTSFASGGYEAYLDLDKLKRPLFLRKRKEGDKFQPLGMRGRKKIKDFFIDLKIPREERDKIPLLISKDRIAWIVGYRLDENFKVTRNTRRVLRIKVSKSYE
ncbi:tRNA lysidine(34) synthetase TilS [Candidatus Aerophobetes bacterium]|nr:tRNA lysidine(34) synthetase TilS [Candidatus Aerophobetes bacterium]